MICDPLSRVGFTSEARSDQVQSDTVALYLSDDGEGSGDVTGVGGVEHPTGEPLLLGVVDGPELSWAPSPCLSGVMNVGDSGTIMFGLERK